MSGTGDIGLFFSSRGTIQTCTLAHRNQSSNSPGSAWGVPKKQQTHLVVPQHQNPVVDLVGDLVIAFARYKSIELRHARLIRSLFVLFLLVLDALRDASYDGDSEDGSTQEETETESRHVGC